MDELSIDATVEIFTETNEATKKDNYQSSAKQEDRNSSQLHKVNKIIG